MEYSIRSPFGCHGALYSGQVSEGHGSLAVQLNTLTGLCTVDTPVRDTAALRFSWIHRLGSAQWTRQWGTRLPCCSVEYTDSFKYLGVERCALRPVSLILWILVKTIEMLWHLQVLIKFSAAPVCPWNCTWSSSKHWLCQLSSMQVLDVIKHVMAQTECLPDALATEDINVRWQDHMTNEAVCARCEVSRLTSVDPKTWLDWLRHNDLIVQCRCQVTWSSPHVSSWYGGWCTSYHFLQ